MAGKRSYTTIACATDEIKPLVKLVCETASNLRLARILSSNCVLGFEHAQ